MKNFQRIDGCLIVAEISANHGHDLERALTMIEKVKECGANAVKFQAYTPDTMTIDADNEFFRIKHPQWGGQTLYELYKKAYTPWGWFRDLQKKANDAGIQFFATAFDKNSVDFLEELDVPFHKIASFELIDLPLIEYAAKTKKPIILSTGMADEKEIEEAVIVAKAAGASEVILLKCVSSYPARPEEMNLKTLPHMEKRFDCPVGLSDHSLGIGASVAAVCLGARVIEKHFTLSRELKTPDSFFSIEPKELKDLVENIRITEKTLGDVYYGLTEEEENSRVFRRSLFVVRDIKRGERFSKKNVKSIRPCNGLPPKEFKNIVGKKAKQDIKKGTPLRKDIIG
ncbi:MAG: pseudaminic acid synthase [Candidatus Omnitrophota bacterium]